MALGILNKSVRIKGKLADDDVDKLLDRLDHEGQCHDRLYRLMGSSARAHKRHRYRMGNISVILNEAGHDVTLLVIGRDLSAGGLGLIHAGPITVGIPCRVRLVDGEGQAHQIAGKIVHCRRVQKNLHAVGIQFDEQIDPAGFLAQAQA